MEEGYDLPVKETLTESGAPDHIQSKVLGRKLDLAWSQKDLVLGSIFLLKA